MPRAFIPPQRIRTNTVRKPAVNNYLVRVRTIDLGFREIDIRDVITRMFYLDTVRRVSYFTRFRADIPIGYTAHTWAARKAIETLTIRRRRDNSFSGRAWMGERIHLSLGQDLPMETVENICVHEVLHFVMPQGTFHGPRFRQALLDACEELVPESTRWVKNRGGVYDMEVYIRRGMMRARRQEWTRTLDSVGFSFVGGTTYLENDDAWLELGPVVKFDGRVDG